MYKLFASALLAAAAVAQDDDVSRLGKNIKMVVVVSNGGVEYPAHNFGLATDPAMNNVGVPGELTPLGQRQQFLIGSELRTRYVEESRTLLYDYYVPQTYMQTAFKQSAILSLQAQMMGLFPNSHVNDLTEWQQQNAVPPLDGVDFTEWQKELGASALPYGLNIFPIQQVGRDADFTLSLDGRNCQRYGSEIAGPQQQLNKQLNAQFQAYPQIMNLIVSENQTPMAFCDYLQWSYITGVELIGNTQDYDTLRTGACREYYQQSLEAAASVNKSDNHIVSTSFTSNLIGLLKTAQNLPEPHPAAEELNDISSERTTGRFYSYVTLTSEQFFAIATSTLDGDFTNVEIPASSTLVFEVDSTNHVTAWLNDEAYFMANCGDYMCGIDAYTSELQKTVVYTDLASACQTAPFIQ